MVKALAKSVKTGRSPACRRAQETNGVRKPQRAVPSKAGRTKRAKRELRPDQKTPKKRATVPKPSAQDCEEDVRVRVQKRSIREDGEGPSKQKMKRRRVDVESASSSTDTRGTNGSTTQHCAVPSKARRTKRAKRQLRPDQKTSKKRATVPKPSAQDCEEDVRVRVQKRSIREDGEGPSKQTTGRETNGSTIKQRAVPSKARRTKRAKTQLRPDQKTSKKRARVPQPSAQDCEEDVRVRVQKRSIREDVEGPSKQKMKRRRVDVESASSSTDTRETNGSRRTKRAKRQLRPDQKTSKKRARVPKPSAQDCEEDVRVRVQKRSIREDVEGPSKQKMKRRRVDVESASSSTDTREGDVSKKAVKKNNNPDQSEIKQQGEVNNPIACFKAKYTQKEHIGQGGCGSVFAGYRKADRLEVAIKHVAKDKVYCTQTDKNGKQLSMEVAVMLKHAAESTGAVGSSASISLLDWYDVGKELILVLERPMPAIDLFTYILANAGCLSEDDTKVIFKQLLDAVKELEDMGIFHRDIKTENILIEMGSDVPRVRLIDFGLSCFTKKGSCFRIFYGTSAHAPPEWYCRWFYRAGPTTVWQLGVVLYEMLHATGPFETIQFLCRKLKISPKLSQNCIDFLKMCLSKYPDKRPTLEQLQRHPWLTPVPSGPSVEGGPLFEMPFPRFLPIISSWPQDCGGVVPRLLRELGPGQEYLLK